MQLSHTHGWGASGHCLKALLGVGGAAVMHNFALEGLLDGGLKLRPMTLPDRFIEHGSQVGARGAGCCGFLPGA